MAESLNPAPIGPPAPRVKADVSLFAFYFMLVLTPIVLKLLHRTRVAEWSWQKVTVFLWGPWAMLVLLSLIGWGIRLYNTHVGRA